jgi:hypothetical protein
MARNHIIQLHIDLEFEDAIPIHVLSIDQVSSNRNQGAD